MENIAESAPQAAPQGSEAPIETIPVKENVVKPGVTLEGINVGGLGSNEVEKLVSELAANVDREARNAEINRGSWEVSGSEEGCKVDITGTVNKIMESREGSSLRLIVDTVQPKYTQKQLQDGIIVISQYSTTLIDKSPGRVNNIKLAASSIDSYILSPGTEFSFNRSVGRTIASEGYKKAIIIGKDNKREYEVGGGVCQLSTTLYNAAINAGLRITERHPHTKPVPYISPGKDAMVNDGDADMSFVNNRKYPIMIGAEVGSNQVTTWILENRNEIER
jgi:vancomycin resistance protein YoaR